MRFSMIMHGVAHMLAASLAGQGRDVAALDVIKSVTTPNHRGKRPARNYTRATGKTYKPNGARECARRRRQMGIE